MRKIDDDVTKKSMRKMVAISLLGMSGVYLFAFFFSMIPIGFVLVIISASTGIPLEGKWFILPTISGLLVALWIYKGIRKPFKNS